MCPTLIQPAKEWNLTVRRKGSSNHHIPSHLKLNIIPIHENTIVNTTTATHLDLRPWLLKYFAYNIFMPYCFEDNHIILVNALENLMQFKSIGQL